MNILKISYPLSNLCINSNIQGYKFMLVNDELTVETEKYLYDERSLLAEFGGALGLFLGFSFYTLWDIFESFFVSVLEKLKNY